MVNFKNAIIIMTSNLGSHLIQQDFENMNEENRDEIIDSTRNAVFELLKRTIRPEFLNRVDDIIMFKPLDKGEIQQIVKLQFERVRALLAKNGIDLDISSQAIRMIADQGFDPQFGARPIKRIMQRHVLNELSKMILSGKLSKETSITLDVSEGSLVFGN